MTPLQLDMFGEYLEGSFSAWLEDVAAHDIDLTAMLTRAGANDHSVRATPEAVTDALKATNLYVRVEHTATLDLGINNDTLVDFQGELLVFDLEHHLEPGYAIPRQDRIMVLSAVGYHTMSLHDSDAWVLTTEESTAIYSHASGTATCTRCGYHATVSDGGGYLEDHDGNLRHDVADHREYVTDHGYRLTCPACGAFMSAAMI